MNGRNQEIDGISKCKFLIFTGSTNIEHTGRFHLNFLEIYTIRHYNRINYQYSVSRTIIDLKLDTFEINSRQVNRSTM